MCGSLKCIIYYIRVFQNLHSQSKILWKHRCHQCICKKHIKYSTSKNLGLRSTFGWAKQLLYEWIKEKQTIKKWAVYELDWSTAIFWARGKGNSKINKKRLRIVLHILSRKIKDSKLFMTFKTSKTFYEYFPFFDHKKNFILATPDITSKEKSSQIY